MQNAETPALSEQSDLNDISEKEIVTAVRSLKRKQAPGLVGIINEDVLYGRTAAMKPMMAPKVLINLILKLKPDALRCSFIVPIYKGGGIRNFILQTIVQ